MTKPDVYCTRLLPQGVMDRLDEHFSTEVNPEDRVLTHAELVIKVQGRDGVLCLLTDKIDDEVLAAAGPQCKVFANYAVGFNNVDVEAATRRGILVTNTPGGLTDATADLTWALLFATARRVAEADRFTRAGKFDGWAPLMYLGADITGATLGVVGAGRIGTNFALKSQGFKMKVLYTGNRPNTELETEVGARRVELETLLRQSDFVSLHVPLKPETTHLIGEAELKLMKKSAILINTARGPVIDEKALVQALREGEIWGAGLDVYEREPQLEPGLAELDNVVIPPHIASATVGTRTKMGLMAVDNLRAVFSGQQPPQCLNPQVLEASAK